MNKSRMDIIEKIQKLLALATSDNENEAQMAAKRAQELLLKYNLKLTDVELEEGEEKYTREFSESGLSRATQESKYIHSILMSYYFVRIVQTKKPIMDESGLFRVKTEIVHAFLGQTHNVTIALFVRDFLTRAFQDLWKKYQKQTGAKKGAKESFYMGLYKGLDEQLKNTQAKVEQETGLVVVPDADLDQWINDLFNGRLKSKTPARINVQDKQAMAAGHEEGKNLRIARGLGGSSDEQKQVGQTLRIAGSTK